METIKVKISADGSVEYEVNGVKGKKCRDLTKFIDDLSTVVESKTTSEYCEREVEQEKNRGKN